MKKTIVMILLVLVTFSSILRADDPQPKKKGHLWLIPVLAGGAFAAGTFVGLSAFDDAVNSDQKVWTTATLFGVGGGIAGWLIGRPKSEHTQSYGLPAQKFEIRWADQATPVVNTKQLFPKPILSDRK